MLRVTRLFETKITGDIVQASMLANGSESQMVLESAAL